MLGRGSSDFILKAVGSYSRCGVGSDNKICMLYGRRSFGERRGREVREEVFAVVLFGGVGVGGFGEEELFLRNI